jgi:hypothetical protein
MALVLGKRRVPARAAYRPTLRFSAEDLPRLSTTSDSIACPSFN